MMNLRRPRGFTLIELVVVVAVLGIIAATAAPSFREYTVRSKLRGTADEAYGDLQYARSESIQRYVATRVTFSTSGYVVERFDPPTNTWPTMRSVAWSGVTGSSAMVVLFDPIRGQATVTSGPTNLTATGTTAQARLDVNGVGRPSICAVSGVLGGMKPCA